MKRPRLPDRDTVLESFFPDTPLGALLPRPARKFRLSFVKVGLVALNTERQIRRLPPNRLDEIGDVLIDHERVHDAVRVEQSVVEGSECFKG